MTDTPDSFIDEVTEELRRDRLFAAFRRYGWIGITVIVLIVGWSAWLEWSAARQQARAEAFGDQVLAALTKSQPDERDKALAAIPTDDVNQRTVLTLLSATDAAGAERLAALAADPQVPQVYRDLAEFRRLLLAKDMDPAERMAAFGQLTAPGAPYRVLAEEQMALIEINTGKQTDAIARLKTLAQDTEASGALRRRASQLIVALGGSTG